MRDLAIIAVTFAAVLAIRVTAASDLATGDQPLQAAYVRDIVEHGNWIAQHLHDGTPAAKPPLYNWLAAAAIGAAGRSNEFLLKLPSIIAAFIALLLTWSIARTTTGDRAAWIAAMLFCASPMFSKHVYFARTDMLLTMLIVLQMFAAERTRPVLFWTAAALALLTKGPVGVLIPILACSAWWWSDGELSERWNAMRWKLGLPLSLAAFGAWFVAAVATGGRPVFDQLVISETLDRFAAHSSKSKENRHILYYIPHFLARMAPVSLFAVSAIVQRVRGIAFWWLATGFVFLSLIPSKRADRLFPLLPAACIVAGWVIDRWLRGTTTLIAVLAVAFASAAVTLPFVAPATTLAVVCATAMFICALAIAFGAWRRAPRISAGAIAAAMLVAIFIYQHGVIASDRLQSMPHP